MIGVSSASHPLEMGAARLLVGPMSAPRIVSSVVSRPMTAHSAQRGHAALLAPPIRRRAARVALVAQPAVDPASSTVAAVRRAARRR